MNEENPQPILTPDLQSSLLCDDVRQERNGKFILIGIFEGLMVSSFPAVFHRLCIVNRWCCGEGEFHQLSRIVSSDGKTKLVEGRSVPVRLKNVNQVATSIEYFVNVRIPEAGDYWIEVLLNDHLRLRYPLHARKQHEKT